MSPVAPILDRLTQRIGALAAKRRPVVIGLDGPVAVGKSTFATGLAERLRSQGLPTVVIGADGFLWPAATLAARGLMSRKGFPDSFDRAAMADFLTGLRAGAAPSAPVYSHAAYDRSASERRSTAGAAVVIMEGVNVLGEDLRALYDLAIYLDADPAAVEAWFLARFAAVPFSEARAAALAPWRPKYGDVLAWGRAVWDAINAPNWTQHIAKGRDHADLVIRKAADHSLTLA